MKLDLRILWHCVGLAVVSALMGAGIATSYFQPRLANARAECSDKISEVWHQANLVMDALNGDEKIECRKVKDGND